MFKKILSPWRRYRNLQTDRRRVVSLALGLIVMFIGFVVTNHGNRMQAERLDLYEWTIDSLALQVLVHKDQLRIANARLRNCEEISKNGPREVYLEELEMQLSLKTPYKTNMGEKAAKNLVDILNKCDNIPLKRFTLRPQSYTKGTFQVWELNVPPGMTPEMWKGKTHGTRIKRAETKKKAYRTRKHRKNQEECATS